MNQPVITVKNLTYKFGDYIALDNVNFVIEPGDMTAIIGPNGSGKTTLLKNIIGVYEPTAGSVKVLDKHPSRVIKNIGYVPQKFEFDRDIPISVYEYMALEKCEKENHSQINIHRALKEVGLNEVEKKKLGELSGGQFQRVMIAKALLHEKAILIFDEPSTGIDIAGEQTIYDLIKKINKEKGITCLIVSHELNIVNKYANKVICLNKKMICSGTPETVITPENLRHLYGIGAKLYHTH
ncbi:MAG: ABC transporter ATP-binding protein [Candidatus Magasanikbacteria bacterium CG10_big_fil_rev_8_21_14_0_10_40_10]|uniref:ABC transporter ATP-binding protein n=1 Tax=Candidatus Magasanikbacteria bacterium CG10_big_fil_rev_8_21_14_0_10_40_10 TaxID=1974648 RepID=A0A2M6W4P8_9BACT|nr:MAG: ABC transporter ATP-binding protein [Candidatus Magasanikbacteria bacterium CG10_big_fil_rev_8_21_14_0_10_40_10]